MSSANMIYSSPVVPPESQILSTALLNNSIYSPNKSDIAELLTPSRRIHVPACISEPIASFQQILGVSYHPKSEHLLKILNEYTHSRNVKSSEEALYNGVAMCFMEQIYLTDSSQFFESSLRTLFPAGEEWIHTELYGFFAYIKSFLEQNPGDHGFYDAIVRDPKLYVKGVAAFREVMCRVLAELDTEKKRDGSILFGWLNEYDFLTQEIFSKLAHLLHCKIRIIIVSHLSFMEETFFFAENPDTTMSSHIGNADKIREYTVLYDFTSDKSYLLYHDADEEKKQLETILEAAQENVETPTEVRESNHRKMISALNWLRNVPKSPYHHIYEPALSGRGEIEKENFSPSLVDKITGVQSIAASPQISQIAQIEIKIQESEKINEQFSVLQNLMNKYRIVKEQIDDISGDLQKFDMTYVYSGGLETRDLNAASSTPDSKKGLSPLIASVLQGFVYQNELLKVQLDQISHTIYELREKGTAKGAEIKGLRPTIDHDKVRSRQNSIMQSFITKNELAKMQIDELSSVLARLEEQKLSSNFDSQGGLMSPQTDTEYIVKAPSASHKLESNYGTIGNVSEQRTFTDPFVVNDSQTGFSQGTGSEIVVEEDKVNNMSSTLEGRRPRLSVEADFPKTSPDYTAPISAPLFYIATDFSVNVDPLIKLVPVGAGSATISFSGAGLEKEILEENLSSGVTKIEEEEEEEDVHVQRQIMMNSANSGEGLEPKGSVVSSDKTPKHGGSRGERSPPALSLEESPESKKKMETLIKAEKWLGLRKTPEKGGFYMQTEVQTPNRHFGGDFSLDISKRKSCRSTSPKKTSRESITVVLPLDLKAKFENMNKKVEKNNAEFNFMVEKRMTQNNMNHQNSVEKTCPLGEIFEKYQEIVENKKIRVSIKE